MIRKIADECQWCETRCVLGIVPAKQRFWKGKDFFLENGFAGIFVLEEQTVSSANLYYGLILCRFPAAIQVVYPSSSGNTAAHNALAL